MRLESVSAQISRVHLGRAVCALAFITSLAIVVLAAQRLGNSNLLNPTIYRAALAVASTTCALTALIGLAVLARSSRIERTHDQLRNVLLNEQNATPALELINSGQIDVNYRAGPHEETPLHWVVSAPMPEADLLPVAVQLIKKGALLEAKNTYEQTPLLLAASMGKWELVKLLVDNDANVNAPDEWEVTALSYAVSASTYNDSLEVVRMLIAGGADVNAENVLENSILDIAISDVANGSSGREVIFELLLNGATLGENRRQALHDLWDSKHWDKTALTQSLAAPLPSP